MNPSLNARLATSLLLALSGPVLSAPMTWGVNATFLDAGAAVFATVTGTVTFDDAPVAGFFDGIVDPNDTHVTGAFRLTSATLGLSDTLFTPIAFQPYYYADKGDGPHVDFNFPFGVYSMSLGDFDAAALNDSASTSSWAGTWSFDRNVAAVPVPATLALAAVGLALLGAARTRRRRSC